MKLNKPSAENSPLSQIIRNEKCSTAPGVGMMAFYKTVKRWEVNRKGDDHLPHALVSSKRNGITYEMGFDIYISLCVHYFPSKTPLMSYMYYIIYTRVFIKTVFMFSPRNSVFRAFILHNNISYYYYTRIRICIPRRIFGDTAVLQSICRQIERAPSAAAAAV